MQIKLAVVVVVVVVIYTGKIEGAVP